MFVPSDALQPSIVRLLEFDGPRLTLSLEYIDGKALSRLVDSNGMSMISEGHQFTVWRNISSALQYLHDQDIVHNDIKPENIIMRNDSDSLRNNPDSIAILCDFGVAASSLVFRGGGTPCYLAPQFMYGERGKPSDIWAFGVTMLFVLNYMPLPNAFWEINEVQRKADALVRMVDWLGRVRKIRAGLPEEMKLLSRMLMEEADSRITAPSLCKAVKLSAKRDMAYK